MNRWSDITVSYFSQVHSHPFILSTLTQTATYFSTLLNDATLWRVQRDSFICAVTHSYRYTLRHTATHFDAVQIDATPWRVTVQSESFVCAVTHSHVQILIHVWFRSMRHHRQAKDKQ